MHSFTIYHLNTNKTKPAVLLALRALWGPLGVSKAQPPSKIKEVGIREVPDFLWKVRPRYAVGVRGMSSIRGF